MRRCRAGAGVKRRPIDPKDPRPARHISTEVNEGTRSSVDKKAVAVVTRSRPVCKRRVTTVHDPPCGRYSAPVVGWGAVPPPTFRSIRPKDAEGQSRKSFSSRGSRARAVPSTPHATIATVFQDPARPRCCSGYHARRSTLRTRSHERLTTPTHHPTTRREPSRPRRRDSLDALPLSESRPPQRPSTRRGRRGTSSVRRVSTAPAPATLKRTAAAGR
jgi:hypothetical protein